jgi:7-cyano-7-deazaguanine reductase
MSTKPIKKKGTYTDKISESLGSANSYAVSTDKFDPKLLNPIPRLDARKDWGIKGTEFVGKDVWHCHEATFLTNSGIPVAGTLKFSYDSSSKDMIESKSMKLYLNSFDMCKMGGSVQEAINNYESRVEEDLTEALNTEIEVSFHPSGSHLTGQRPLTGYVDLYNIICENEDSIEITDYEAKKSHLLFTKSDDETATFSYKVATNVLRSRCRHTKQKDTGSAYIYLQTRGAELSLVSLFKEIVALREVNEFHEFCAEKLYTAIMKSKFVTECVVTLLYSRRGSLDINPVRATREDLLPQVLINTDIYTVKTQGQ